MKTDAIVLMPFPSVIRPTVRRGGTKAFQPAFRLTRMKRLFKRTKRLTVEFVDS